MGQVERVDPHTKAVYTNIGTFHYDYLVIATGAETNYFGNEAVEYTSMPLKTIPIALNIRSYVLQAFEEAILHHDMDGKRQSMTFVIVGAVPTGVELAGAFAEFKRNMLPRDYKELDSSIWKCI